jgi:hypothetical protein
LTCTETMPSLAVLKAAKEAARGAMRTGRPAQWTRLWPDPLPEGRQRAMVRLRQVYGLEGLGLSRAVLTGQSVEAAVWLGGAESAREMWFWSRLFRRCLGVQALAFGFSTSAQRPPRLKGMARSIRLKILADTPLMASSRSRDCGAVGRHF